ncbi:transcription factor Sp2 isoform X2 [Drosophila busckii]|uniref:transcription factor Sp2 isoform X2 n=1 Tax=Drosophila busckii TaxID=30019 RepID=UPI00083EDF4B|nr:transcription factor Sp2 isoform X2 [Drosophila busckii]
MSNVLCINYWDLCRICTACSEQRINIFSSDGRAKNLSQKIVDCLSIQIDEKDRLPKVICAQCIQQVEQIDEMRSISKNSQTILANWLNHRTLQGDDKVFIRDAISETGKSLSVLGTASGGLFGSGSLNNSSSSNANQPNDLLTSIIRAVGMQVQTQPHAQQQPQGQQQQQYSISVDNVTQSQFQAEVKAEKQNTLEEFIRLKPDIKITPLGKKDNVQNTSSTATVCNIKQQQPLQQQLQTQHSQSALSSMHGQAIVTESAQVQVQPQQINEQAIWHQFQQLQLQQQLQQITNQLQAQAQLTGCTAEDGIGSSESKKPKLNLVLSSPIPTPQFAGTLQQFGGVACTSQPQIQLQLLSNVSSSTSSGAGAISAAAPLSPQQLNAAALLSSLTGNQVSGSNSAINMLSPNKCFLPITIRDENSDQQIVAHIDTKNFVLPTTYQVQMKLQPQLATADGQPIMQLTPTSIPATLQLTPQTRANTSNFHQAIQTTQSNQFLAPQPAPQQQQLPPATALVTSNQIIRSPHANTNTSQLVIRNVSGESSSPGRNDAAVTFKVLSPGHHTQHQQQVTKYKPNPLNASSVGVALNPNVSHIREEHVKEKKATAPSNVAALQRLSSHTTITKLSKTLQQQHQEQLKTGKKIPLLNKQNITISRIPTQGTPKTEPKPTTSAVQPQFVQVQTQQLPQSLEEANQNKSLAKPLKHESTARPKHTRPPQILPVPALQRTLTQHQVSEPQQQPAQVAITSITNTGASTTPSALALHALTCPTCQREFKKKEHLTQHVKLHAGLRPFKCSEDGCDKAFSRKEHLSRHLVSHSGQKMYTCDECKKPFSRKDNLNKHKRSHNTQTCETRMHHCEICNKNFPSKQLFEKHNEMHKKSLSGKAEVQPSPTPNQVNQYELKQQIHQKPEAQQQPQIMQVDLDGNTITIRQASDSSIQTSLSNFVQLGFPQYQNAVGTENPIASKLEK